MSRHLNERPLPQQLRILDPMETRKVSRRMPKFAEGKQSSEGK